MKRILSLVLSAAMIIFSVPMAYATNNYDQGTQVIYTADNEANENWTITVPAKLQPGKSGTVTLDGYWPSNKTITVDADDIVVLKNSILSSDTKTLNITFPGITKSGNNIERSTAMETVSVQAIENALFGTWNGSFYYNVETSEMSSEIPLLDVYSEGDYVYTPQYEGNQFGAQTLDEAWERMELMLAAQGATWQDMVDMYAQYDITEEELKAMVGLTEETFVPSTKFLGYSVAINETVTDRAQTAYGPILKTVQGYPVTSLKATFQGCTNLEIAPEIPDTVTNMYCAFQGCSALTEASAIPSSVVNMQYTFDNCSSLVQAPDMSQAASVQNMEQTFANTALKEAPIIPESVTTLSYAFYDCSDLIAAPAIPCNVVDLSSAFVQCSNMIIAPDLRNATKLQDMSSAFSGCEKLSTYPGSNDEIGDFTNYLIPSSVSDMGATFRACNSLIQAPDIPDNVLDVSALFIGCNSLTTAPVLPAMATDLSGLFMDCPSLKTYVGSTDADYDFSSYTIPQGAKDVSSMFSNTPITKAPAIPSSVKDMGYAFFECAALIEGPDTSNATSVTDMTHAFHSCTSLTKAPIIPVNVVDMTNIFWNCKSLTGIIEIHAHPTEYTGVFYGIDFNTQNITLTGSSTMLDEIGQASSFVYCTICNGTCQNNH